jgi:dihydrodipicolinate synthase/N-acetylneuraminate lyase
LGFPAAGWSGVFPSICTPFARDDSVDPKGQRDVVRFALSSGARGNVCFGLAGEFTKLTVDERKMLCEVILAEISGRVPVLVGVGAEAQRVSIELAQHAARAGADGIVVPAPMATQLSPDILEHYFVSVAESTSLPVMIQDAPAYLGVALAPELINRVTYTQPNVQAVNLECGPEDTAEWMARLEPPLRVFSGDGGVHMLTTLRAGVVGIIPCVEFTDVLVAIADAEREGDSERADRMHAQILPYLVFSLQNLNHLNACTKAVLVRRGVLGWEGLRMPARALTTQAHTLIDRYLTSFADQFPLSAVRSSGAGTA